MIFSATAVLFSNTTCIERSIPGAPGISCKAFFVVYPSICHVVIILCDVGGGVPLSDTRAAAPAAASRLLSYCQNPGAPPHSRLGGALTHAVSGDRDPNSSIPLTTQTIDNANQ